MRENWIIKKKKNHMYFANTCWHAAYDYEKKYFFESDEIKNKGKKSGSQACYFILIQINYQDRYPIWTQLGVIKLWLGPIKVKKHNVQSIEIAPRGADPQFLGWCWWILEADSSF